MQSEIIHHRELDKLLQACDLFNEGLQVRLISGEAGSGKSVLLDCFREYAVKQEVRLIVAGTSCPVCTGQAEPYQIFRDILQMVVKEVNRRREVQQTKREKWDKALGISADILLKIAPDLIENFIPMGSLVNSIGDKVVVGSGLQKKVDKLKTGKSPIGEDYCVNEQYAEVLKMVATHYPLLIWVDNMQWLDRSSVELLHRICVVLKHEPVILMGCFRSSDVCYLPAGERHPLETFITHSKIEYGETFVDLNSLNRGERFSFMMGLLNREPNRFGKDFTEELFRRTGGNPLFVEELLSGLKAKREVLRGADGVWETKVLMNWDIQSVRIDGIIRERLSVMEEDCWEILNYGAVQGEHFLLQVVACLSERTLEEVQSMVSGRLEQQYHLVVESECFRLGDIVVSSFDFNNCLFREYVYNRMSAASRMYLHGKVARILEDLYVGKYELISRQLMFHYENSGEHLKALQYADLCIRQAQMSECFRELLEITNGALGILDKIPISEKQGEEQLKWKVRATLYGRVVYGRRHKYQLPDWQGYPEQTEYAPAWFWEYWRRILLEGETVRALEVAEDFIAGSEDSEFLKCVGRQAVAISLFWLGDYTGCRRYLIMLEGQIPDDEGLGERMMLYYMYRALAAFQLGDYEEAECWCHKNREREGEKYAKALRLQTELWLAFLDGDIERMRPACAKLAEIAGEYGFEVQLEMSRMFEGFLIAGERMWPGIARIREAYGLLDIPLLETLCGMMVCRVFFEKGLRYELKQEVERVIQEAEKKGIKAYRREIENCRLKN